MEDSQTLRTLLHGTSNRYMLILLHADGRGWRRPEQGGHRLPDLY